MTIPTNLEEHLTELDNLSNIQLLDYSTRLGLAPSFATLADVREILYQFCDMKSHLDPTSKYNKLMESIAGNYLPEARKFCVLTILVKLATYLGDLKAMSDDLAFETSTLWEVAIDNFVEDSNE